MASREDLYNALRNADKAGDVEGAKKLAQYIATLPVEESQAESGGMLQGAGNLLAGAVRGAGSIGATILTPYDMLMGNTKSIGNPERRQAMTDALQTMGADTDSAAFSVGKIGGEIAGTLGVGPALAGGARALPLAARYTPNVIKAIETGGMSAGAGGMAARTAGGAISGGASAALVDPETAGMGATVGGALPGGMKLAGMAGNAIGRLVRGPAQTAAQTAAIQSARGAGYVVPPSQAQPSLVNRVLEGAAGKITTAQNASAKNQGVTNKLAAQALGLPADTTLTPAVLTNIRTAAGQAYNAIGSTGAITPAASYSAALDNIAAPYLKAAQAFPNAKPSPVLDLVESLRSPTFDAAAAVEKIKQLRTAADDAFRTGNTDVARASRSAAGALEDAIEGHLNTIGSPDLLRSFREARQLIAKTYTVEKALNPASGTVDAKKLAQQLAKGKPLSGDLRKAAEFAASFPKAAQTPETMGSLPQWSPLDLYGGMGIAGIGGAVTGNPIAALGLALPMARSGARSAALSPAVQNRLAQTPQGQNAIQALLSDPRFAQIGYRAAPVAATSGGR